jgi:hypothetical protein
MKLQEKIALEIPGLKPNKGEDVLQMTEDIYHYFSQLDDFEVLRAEYVGDPTRMVVAACITTMQDPFFKLVVAHTWQNDLAFDNQWCEFEVTDQGTVFRFLTWEDEYICGEIWFERAKLETI